MATTPSEVPTNTGGALAGTTSVIGVTKQSVQSPRTIYSDQWMTTEKAKPQEKKP